jgi:hypothetical protein
VRRLPRDYARNAATRHWKTPLPSLSLASFLSHSLSHGWLGRTALSPSHSFLFLVWAKKTQLTSLSNSRVWLGKRKTALFLLSSSSSLLYFLPLSFSRTAGSNSLSLLVPPLQLSSPFQSLFDFTKGREQHAPCCLYNGGKGPHFLHA